MSISRRTALTTLLSLPAIALARPARAATHKVVIKSFKFVPAQLNVAVGDTVVFENQDGAFVYFGSPRHLYEGAISWVDVDLDADPAAAVEEARTCPDADVGADDDDFLFWGVESDDPCGVQRGAGRRSVDQNTRSAGPEREQPWHGPRII